MIPIIIKYNGPSNNDCMQCPYSCTRTCSVRKSSSCGVKINNPRLIPPLLFHFVSIQPRYTLCGQRICFKKIIAPRRVCGNPQVHCQKINSSFFKFFSPSSLYKSSSFCFFQKLRLNQRIGPIFYQRINNQNLFDFAVQFFK